MGNKESSLLKNKNFYFVDVSNICPETYSLRRELMFAEYALLRHCGDQAKAIEDDDSKVRGSGVV